MADPLRICRRCDVLHYENCPTCFGFGVFGETAAPVAAGDALRVTAGTLHLQLVRACPSCGSTVGALGPNPSPDTSDPLTIDT